LYIDYDDGGKSNPRPSKVLQSGYMIGQTLAKDFKPGGFGATFGGLSRLLDDAPEKQKDPNLVELLMKVISNHATAQLKCVFARRHFTIFISVLSFYPFLANSVWH